MRTTVFITLTLIIFACFSCQRINTTDNHPVIKVSLTETIPTSISDLFSNVEIIPLQTKDEAFFRSISKLTIYRDTIFIFDKSLNSLFLFNKKGEYLTKIDRVGNGPEEYIMAYDFVINSESNNIQLLNPTGSIHIYGFDGKFIGKRDLPKPPYGYAHFEMFEKDKYITWSRVDGDQVNAVNVITVNDPKIIDGYFHNSGIWGAFRLSSVFYEYEDTVFYYETLTPKVYRITPNDCKIAYEWDFGKDMIDPQRLIALPEEVGNRQRELVQDFQKGKIPFCIASQFQSDQYLFTLLMSGQGGLTNVFHNKGTGENRVFEKTAEGIVLNIRYMSDDCVIGILDYNDREFYKDLVSADDVALLNAMTENDNTWLVKYVFKK